MRRMLLVFFLSVGLFSCCWGSQVAQAGKGGGFSSGGGGRSSGKSFSSGSPGKSSSTSSSFKGKSYSSGSNTTGKSYASSSSSNKPPTASGSSSGGKGGAARTTPSSARSSPAPGPARNNSSSGRGSSASAGVPASSQSARPTRGSYDSGPGLAQRKVESKASFGKSYSSGLTKAESKSPLNKGYSSGSPSNIEKATATRRNPAGKAYSLGSPSRNGTGAGSKYSSGAGIEKSSTMKPAGGSYDSSAGLAQRKEESKAAFLKGQTAKTNYVDPQGKTHAIDPKDLKIQQLRDQLDHERWSNRDLRKQQSFGNYYSQPVVVYHDPYSSFFWWWLMSQSWERQALWSYHHRDSMDEARYRELLARDAGLETRIKQLEAQGVKRDPTYKPEGLEPDLMYTDEFVEAAYNPQVGAPSNGSAGHSASPIHRQISSSAKVWRVILTICGIIGIVTLGVWLVFFKRWGAKNT